MPRFFPRPRNLPGGLFPLLYAILLLATLALLDVGISRQTSIQLPIASHAGPPAGARLYVLEIPFRADMTFEAARTGIDLRCRLLAETLRSDEEHDRAVADSLPTNEPFDSVVDSTSGSEPFLDLETYKPQPPTLTIRIDRRAKARLISEATEAALHHRFGSAQFACCKNPGAPPTYFAQYIAGSSYDYQPREVRLVSLVISISHGLPTYRISQWTSHDLTSQPEENTKPVPFNQLRSLADLSVLLHDISAKYPRRFLIIDPDDSVTVQQFVDTWDAGLAAGFQLFTMTDRHYPESPEKTP